MGTNFMTTENEMKPAAPVESPDGGRCALAAGSVLKGHELDALLRAAKVLDREALTWCEGFAVKRGTHWIWNKEYEWAQLRAMHCTNAANNLRAIHARHSSPNSGSQP
jgi:hypothetical protein